MERTYYRAQLDADEMLWHLARIDLSFFRGTQPFTSVLSSAITVIADGRDALYIDCELDTMECVGQYCFWSDKGLQTYPMEEYSFEDFCRTVPEEYADYLKNYRRLRTRLERLVPELGEEIDPVETVRWIFTSTPVHVESSLSRSGGDFSARAVLWRDSRAPVPAQRHTWDLYILIRNEGQQAVSVPRVCPDAYNTLCPNEGRILSSHYDCFRSKYPDDYVALAAKEVHVWRLTIAPQAALVDLAVIEMVVSASFVAYIEAKPSNQSVECFLVSRQSPAPEEWITTTVPERTDE